MLWLASTKHYKQTSSWLYFITPSMRLLNVRITEPVVTCTHHSELIQVIGCSLLGILPSPEITLKVYIHNYPQQLDMMALIDEEKMNGLNKQKILSRKYLSFNNILFTCSLDQQLNPDDRIIPSLMIHILYINPYLTIYMQNIVGHLYLHFSLFFYSEMIQILQLPSRKTA